MDGERVGDTGTVGNEGERGAVFITRLPMTAFLIGCSDLDMARIVGLGLSIKGQAGVSRVETADVGSLRVAMGPGECVLAFVRLLLTAIFLTSCCIVFDATVDGSFVSPFEGQGSVACAEMAGGSFGDERVARDEGERIDSSICSLLTTILSVGRFVDEFAST